MSVKNYRLVRLLLLIFLGVWLVLIMFPFYFQIITSLKDVAEVNRIEPTFWPEEFVTENYVAIWNEPGNFKSLIDSFIIATCNTILSLVVGTLAGYALARFPRQSGGENVAMWILSNRMFPPVAVLLPMFFLFEELFGTTEMTDNYAMIAEGMGAVGITVTDPSEVAPALKRAVELNSDGRTVLLDIHTNMEARRSN